MKLNELTREWSYRVPTGSPDPTDAGHVEVLRGILQEKKYPRRFIEALLDRLTGLSEKRDLVPAWNKDKKKWTNALPQTIKDNPDLYSKKGPGGESPPEDLGGTDDSDQAEPKAAAEPKAKKDPDDLGGLVGKKKGQDWNSDEVGQMFSMILNTFDDMPETEKQGAMNAISRMVMSMFAYRPINTTLNEKGFGARETVFIDPDDPEGETTTTSSELLKRFTQEIQNRLQKEDPSDQLAFANFLKTPIEDKPDFPQDHTGNLHDTLGQTGVPLGIIAQILQHTSQDEGKRGIGMGEFGMGMFFRNIRNSPTHGDLGVVRDGEIAGFEIKGNSATLGPKPGDHAPLWANLQKLFNIRVGTKPGGSRKGLIHNGKYYLKSALSHIVSAEYKSLDEPQREQFKVDFKQMILEDVYDINVAPEKRKDVITSELYDQVVETLQPDFTDTKSVNDFVMLVNFVNYATKEKFTHFLAHDFGSNGPNTGDYIYVYGTPLEMAKQLQEAGVRFEPLADKNFRGRIGFSDNKHV